jgi:TPR repeat protein
LRNVDLADNNDNVLSALYVEKCYRYGIGVKKDLDMADKYHKKAISLGIPRKPNTQMTAP